MNMEHIQNVQISIPSFEPLEYNPNELNYVKTETSNQTEEFVPPTVEPPKYEPKKKEDKPLFAVRPGQQDQRVGDYRNEFKLKRVIGHKKSEDGSKCITLYEDVKFIEQYIPNPSRLLALLLLLLLPPLLHYCLILSNLL